MKFNLQNQNKDQTLIERLFDVRNISDDPNSFVNAKFADYRLDPLLLNDMGKSVDRILEAFKKKEKIMIFGDYDVDGVTSSFTLFHFFKDWLHYPHVEIQYPSRKLDGYGLKNKHLDMMKEKNIDLVITVDNGITSVGEAEYAKEIGLDLIITDHHHAGAKIPDALAVVNPQVSPDYKFKGLAGVGVAFKLLNAILGKSNIDVAKKKQIFEYFLPIVAIGTVADVVPLRQENRVIVKRGLELMNFQRHKIPACIDGFLNFLNIKNKINTYHIGFQIGPRINAGGRIASPYDSLNMLLYSGETQLPYLQKIDDINTERKKIQEEAIKIAEKKIKLDQKMLIAFDESFNEGIVGIVSGRITEKYNRPSMVITKKDDEELYTASLRAPDYFNLIDMIQDAGHLLESFGGHKCAGGLSVKPENFEKLEKYFEVYCQNKISDDMLEKEISVDTFLSPEEWDLEILAKIDRLSPFGEGNPEPIFLLEGVNILQVNKIGKNGSSHLKLLCNYGDDKFSCMLWGKGEELDEYKKIQKANIVGKVKRDDYNGGFMVDAVSVNDV